MKSELFGSIPSGDVYSHTVSNAAGVSFTVIDYGATLLSVSTPDKEGNIEEITLNYSTLSDIISNHGPYYGCIAGRVANRIAKGKFTLDGEEYTLAVNNGQNHLHGGIVGFDQKIWHATEFSTDNSAGVEFTCISVEGEEGYPGNLDVSYSRISLTSYHTTAVAKDADYLPIHSIPASSAVHHCLPFH